MEFIVPKEQIQNDFNKFTVEIKQKIEKLQQKGKTEKLKFILKNSIEKIKNIYGNKSEFLFELYEKHISILKYEADNAFNNKDFTKSLDFYLQCYKMSEPIPGSEWTKFESWYKLRIDILKLVAINYERLEKIDKAVEFLRISINLEDKAESLEFDISNNNNIDYKYDQLYYMISNHLVLLENYNEALKYLVKLEKFYDREYKISQTIKSEKSNLRQFVMDNNGEIISKYLNVLNLISNAYIKVGKFDEGEKFYEKRIQIANTIQKLKFKQNYLKIDDSLNNEAVIKKKSDSKKRPDRAETDIDDKMVNNKEKLEENSKIEARKSSGSNSNSKTNSHLKLQSVKNEFNIREVNKIPLNNSNNKKESNFKSRPETRAKHQQSSKRNSKEINKLVKFQIGSSSVDKDKGKSRNISPTKTIEIIPKKKEKNVIQSTTYDNKNALKNVKTTNKFKTNETIKIPFKYDITITQSSKNERVLNTQSNKGEEQQVKTTENNTNQTKYNFTKSLANTIAKSNLEDLIKKNALEMEKKMMEILNRKLQDEKEKINSKEVRSKNDKEENLKKEKSRTIKKEILSRQGSTQTINSHYSLKRINTKNSLHYNEQITNTNESLVVNTIVSKEEDENDNNRKSSIESRLSNQGKLKPILKSPSTLKKRDFKEKNSFIFNPSLNKFQKLDNELHSKLSNLEKKKNLLPPLSSDKKSNFTPHVNVSNDVKYIDTKAIPDKNIHPKPFQSKVKIEDEFQKIENNIQQNNFDYNLITSEKIIDLLRIKISQFGESKKEIVLFRIMENFYYKIYFRVDKVEFNIDNNKHYLHINVFFEKLSISNIHSVYSIMINLNVDAFKQMLMQNEIIFFLWQSLDIDSSDETISTVWPYTLVFFEMWFQNFLEKFKTTHDENINGSDDKSEIVEKRKLFKKFFDEIELYLDKHRRISDRYNVNIPLNSLKSRTGPIKQETNINNIDNHSKSVIINFFTCILKFLSFSKTTVGNIFNIKDLKSEEIKIKRAMYLSDIHNFYKRYMDFLPVQLIKILVFDSFVSLKTNNANVVNNDYDEDFAKTNDENKLNHILKYSLEEDLLEEFFCDGKFENILRNSREGNLFERNNNQKQSEINFDKLRFLSTDQEMVKLYENFDKDLNPKFYGKTKYKTFVHFHIIELSSASNWFDNIYIKWETLLTFTSVLKRKHNIRNFSFKYINYNLKLDSLVFEFLSSYFHIYTYFKDADLNITAFEDFTEEERNKSLYGKYKANIENMCFEIMDKFDFYFSFKNFDTNKIKIQEKIFYHNYLSKINEKHLEHYMNKEVASYQNKNWLIDTKCTLIEIETDESSKNAVNASLDSDINYFNTIDIDGNKYIIIIKNYKEKFVLGQDDDIKNLLIEEKYKSKLIIKVKSILNNQWCFNIITSFALIQTLQDVINNCEDNYCRKHLSSIIQLRKTPMGEILTTGLKSIKPLDSFVYRIMKVKGNILNKISLISLNFDKISDYKLKINLDDENITQEKVLTKIIKLRNYMEEYNEYEYKKIQYIFTFKIYKISRLMVEYPKITNNNNLIVLDEDESYHSENYRNNNILSLKNVYSALLSKLQKNSSNIDRNNSKKNKNKTPPLTKNYKIKEENSILCFINIYEPKKSKTYFFIISMKDLSDFFENIQNSKMKKKFLSSYNELIEYIPSKLKIIEEFSGLKILLKYATVKKLNEDQNSNVENREEIKNDNKAILVQNMDESILSINKPVERKYNSPEDKLKEKWDNMKVYLKVNFQNLLVREDIYDITTNEMKLIFKTIKYYKITKSSYSCFISIYYHRILDYWTILFLFPHNQRKFTVNIHQSDISILPEFFRNLPGFETGSEISEFDIWNYLIGNSVIVSNLEGNSFFEVFSIKVLLRELLYFGSEIITAIDPIEGKEKNEIIFVEVTMKTKNKFLIAEINEQIPKIQIENTSVILQSFSFDKFSWHKEIFKLEDYTEYIKDKITYDESTIKMANNTYMPTSDNQLGIEQTNSEIVSKKFIKYGHLRKLALFIVKSYRLNKKLIFEKQYQDVKGMGVINSTTSSMSRLIENIKSDKIHRKNVVTIFNKKIQNMVSEKTIYTEILTNNPTIIASIILNLYKKILIISFYHPRQAIYNYITLEIEYLKENFFPFIDNILAVDAKQLGKRVMNHYRALILNSPAFMKFVKTIN